MGQLFECTTCHDARHDIFVRSRQTFSRDGHEAQSRKSSMATWSVFFRKHATRENRDRHVVISDWTRLDTQVGRRQATIFPHRSSTSAIFPIPARQTCIFSCRVWPMSIAGNGSLRSREHTESYSRRMTSCHTFVYARIRHDMRLMFCFHSWGPSRSSLVTQDTDLETFVLVASCRATGTETYCR